MSTAFVQGPAVNFVSDHQRVCDPLEPAYLKLLSVLTFCRLLPAQVTYDDCIDVGDRARDSYVTATIEHYLFHETRLYGADPDSPDTTRTGRIRNVTGQCCSCIISAISMSVLCYSTPPTQLSDVVAHKHERTARL